MLSDVYLQGIAEAFNKIGFDFEGLIKEADARQSAWDKVHDHMSKNPNDDVVDAIHKQNFGKREKMYFWPDHLQHNTKFSAKHKKQIEDAIKTGRLHLSAEQAARQQAKNTGSRYSSGSGSNRSSGNSGRSYTYEDFNREYEEWRKNTGHKQWGDANYQSNPNYGKARTADEWYEHSRRTNRRNLRNASIGFGVLGAASLGAWAYDKHQMNKVKKQNRQAA